MELEYQNGYKRRLYFRTNAIEYVSMPQFINFLRVPAMLTQDVISVFGSSYEYDDLRRNNRGVMLPAGLVVQVFVRKMAIYL